MEVKFPQIEVELTGKDGNAFSILGAVTRAMKKGKVDEADIAAFMKEATSGGYDHLLQTAMSTVTVSQGFRMNDKEDIMFVAGLVIAALIGGYGVGLLIITLAERARLL